MKKKKTHWVVLAAVALVVLLLAAYILPPLPKPQAQESRVTGVNHLASISITTTNTLATATPSK